MLKEIISDNSLGIKGIVGFYPANSVGDDIYVYESEERTTPKAIFYGKRQQAEIESQKFRSTSLPLHQWAIQVRWYLGHTRNISKLSRDLTYSMIYELR